jgi:L-amino acid N-acyltransferase YncA
VMMHKPEASLTGMIKILVDTNILIQREDEAEMPGNIRSLLKLINDSERVNVVIHPASRDDIMHDHDENRRRVVLSKLATYPEIENPPSAPNQFIKSVYVTPNSHDLLDAAMLYCVKLRVVDFLITEDKRIIRKAEKLNLKDNVLNIDEGLSFFSDLLLSRHLSVPPFVRRGKGYNLFEKLGDPFFDSFRDDYPGFDEWLKTKARDRMCYYVMDQSRVISIAILKEENTPITMAKGVQIPAGRRLKVCSLKVAEESSGNKLIEKLLEIIFNECILNGYDETYVTVFRKHENLIYVLKRFGFEKKGELDNQEELYIKSFRPDSHSYEPMDYLRKYFPHYREDVNVKKVIVPIKQKFQRELFPDLTPNQRLIDVIGGSDLYYPSYGNAIIKIYVSASKVKPLETGTIMLFYKSGNSAGVITLGVVESCQRCDSIEELLSFCGNRTVYSIKQLNEMINKSKSLLAIKFWHINTKSFSFVSKARLKKIGIAIPQSIATVSQAKFDMLKGDRNESHHVY